MAMQIEGMLSPQQAALRQAEGQLKIESLLSTITAESQKIMEASQGPSIIPGTGGKTPGMLMQEQQAKLQAQTQVQNVAAAADWENMAVNQGQELASLYDQKKQVTSKIVQDASVSFFDDPLTAIANAFTLPWDEQKLDAISQRETELTKTMNAAHSHVQQSAVTADKIKSDVTQATLAEQATALENWQRQIAAQARIDSAKTGADVIAKSLAMDKDALHLYMQEVQLRNSEEQMAMARRREERQMQLLDKQLGEVKDKEEAEATYMQFINEALVAEGKNPLGIKDFKYYKQTSADYLDTLARKGIEIRANGSQGYTYGAKIEDRFKFMSTVGWTPKTKQQESVVLMQADAAKKVDPRITDKKLIAEEANKVFYKEFREAQNDIREGSPFSAPSFSVYANTKLASHPVWQKYIAPTLTDTNASTPMTPEFIRSSISKAVKDKTVTSAQAAEFAQSVFEQAVIINNTAHKFKQIAGQEQTKYGVRMDMGESPANALRSNLLNIVTGFRAPPPSFSGFTKNVKAFDATDKTQWEALIARDIASELVKTGFNLGLSKASIPSAESIRQSANLPPLK